MLLPRQSRSTSSSSCRTFQATSTCDDARQASPDDRSCAATATTSTCRRRRGVISTCRRRPVDISSHTCPRRSYPLIFAGARKHSPCKRPRFFRLHRLCETNFRYLSDAIGHAYRLARIDKACGTCIADGAKRRPASKLGTRMRPTACWMNGGCR